MNPTRGNGLLEKILATLRFWKARQLLRPADYSGRLLDIGCGSFPLTLSQLPFRERHGIDQMLEDNLIEELRLQDLHLCNKDFTEGLPFQDDFFDAVIMLAAIEHIDHPERVVAEVGRVLKPGGYFIMTTPSYWTEPILTFLARVGLLSKEELEEHRDLLRPEQLKAMMLDGGFPLSGIEHGYFELGLNQWVRGQLTRR